MAEQYANFGQTTLNGAIDNAVTSLVLTSAAGFPSSGNFRIVIDSEVILVGARSGTTCSSLTRGHEGTAAASHSSGATVAHVVTAGGLTAGIDDRVATHAGAITTSGHTMATNKLLGRGTASTGAIEEITLGTNLSFTGTTLNALSGATSSNYISADVTMTTSGTFYDGPSLTLAAGTYLLMGAVSVLGSTTATREFTAKLWDGSTSFSKVDIRSEGTAQACKKNIPLAAIVSPGGSTTYKISITSNVNSDTLLGTSPANQASYLLAVKLA